MMRTSSLPSQGIPKACGDAAVGMAGCACVPTSTGTIMLKCNDMLSQVCILCSSHMTYERYAVCAEVDVFPYATHFYACTIQGRIRIIVHLSLASHAGACTCSLSPMLALSVVSLGGRYVFRVPIDPRAVLIHTQSMAPCFYSRSPQVRYAQSACQQNTCA